MLLVRDEPRKRELPFIARMLPSSAVKPDRRVLEGLDEEVWCNLERYPVGAELGDDRVDQSWMFEQPISAARADPTGE